MILEGIVTTLGPGGEVNISPMGPRVDVSLNRLILRPYQTSRTYQNLKRRGEGVFHVTDDVLLLAQAALGQPDPLPAMRKANSIEGFVLKDACRWYAFRVTSLDDSRERTEIVADVIDRGVNREFFGFNRAKHAVLEAAILATRVHLLPAEQIRDELRRWQPLVDKTGGQHERQAWELLRTHIESHAARAEERR